MDQNHLELQRVNDKENQHLLRQLQVRHLDEMVQNLGVRLGHLHLVDEQQNLDVLNRDDYLPLADVHLDEVVVVQVDAELRHQLVH
jgi:hypothetical protein